MISLPAGTPIRELVRVAKLRWRVERDYQDLKNEVGLDHFEGRSWPGFHHHAALCAAAYAFLALRRALFSPEHDSMEATDGASAPPAVAPTSRCSANRNAARRFCGKERVVRAARREVNVW